MRSRGFQSVAWVFLEISWGFRRVPGVLQRDSGGFQGIYLGFKEF